MVDSVYILEIPLRKEETWEVWIEMKDSMDRIKENMKTKIENKKVLKL